MYRTPGKRSCKAALALLFVAACGGLDSAVETPTEPPAAATPQAANAAPIERTSNFGAMGTDVSISVIGTDQEALDEALVAAEAELRRVEDLMTSWRDSPLTRMNAKAGSGPQVIDPELASMIDQGLAVGELTGGAFDITFASVGKLWDFKAKPPVLPSQAEIDSALESVGYQKVKLDLKTSTIDFPRGTQIGLGGIAKGYGVDRAMQVLLDRGIKNGIVNAGGDMKVLGTKFGKPWRIAVKHPRDRNQVLAMEPLSNTCMVTSGDYERFFEYNGKRYHHILDPRTGYPATGGMSVTVIAPNAAFADALATGLSVLGPKKGIPLVESLPRVECLIVDMDGGVTKSSGL